MIKDILILQKRELERKLKEMYIERNVDSKKIDNPLIKVIIGPRRSGKSFFLIHFLKNKNVGYVNFDDGRIIEIEDYDKIVSSVKTVYGDPKYLILDEIQNLPKWELFANRLQRQDYNLFITGSNSKLLSKELATHLTGRHFLINMYPFSFKEFLDIEKKELTLNEIKEGLDKYLVNGGFPEPIIKGIDNKEYLSTLFSSVIYKDIVKRYNIRHSQKIEDLAMYLLSNIASEYSYNSLKNMVKIQSVHTIEKYLGYLEESFIFFSLRRFSYKIKEQLSSNKKIYCIDNGFVSSKAFTASPNYGRLYENLVAIKLKKQELENKINFYYWKNPQQEEVDFVIKKGTKVVELIQVCYDLKNLKTREREERVLLKAGKDLKCKNLVIITKDLGDETEKEWFGIKGKIKYIPLWKWLLEKDN
ncbi:MAG: ATP-binding protein [archaeon]